MNVGGRKISEILSLFLLKSGIRLTTSSDKEVVRELKEKHCLISSKESYKSLTSTLPDGQNIQITAEALRLPEMLFYPERYGLECESLLQQIQKSLEHCDLHAKQKLLDNVIVVGGNTLTKGIWFFIE